MNPFKPFGPLLAGFLAFALLEAVCSAQTSNQELLNQIKEPRKFSGPAAQDNFTFLQSEEIGTLELIQKFPKPSTFSVFSSHTFFYTDNLFLTQGNETETVAWLGSVGATYVPYSTFRWTPRVTLEGSLMRYDKASFADFDAQTLTLDSRYDLTENKNFFWNADVSLRRLHSGRPGVGEFYRHVEYNSSLTWVRSPSKQRAIYLINSFGIGGRHASPGIEDRLEASLTFSLLYRPTAKLELQPFLRPAVRYYPNDTFSDHQDMNLYVGMNGIWRPCKNFSLSSGILWIGNYSSEAAEDYEAVLPSVSVSASFEF